jgi:hypothetical protein
MQKAVLRKSSKAAEVAFAEPENPGTGAQAHQVVLPREEKKEHVDVNSKLEVVSFKGLLSLLLQ